MGRLGSGKTKGGTFPGQFDPKLGTFNAELVGLQLYHSDNFNDKNKLDLCLGFIMDIEDPDASNEPQENGLYRHTESFVRLQVDDDGNFGPGGAKAKAYKLLSAFYGEDFNSFDDDFEWWFDFPEGVEFDHIDDVPHHKSYQKDEEWLPLVDIFIKPAGKQERGVMGSRAMIKFGHAQKPDGSYSDKISIIEAIALPRSARSGAAPKASSRAKAAPAPQAAPAPAPAAPATPGANSAPQYIVWVINKATELGIPSEDFQPWFEDFLGEPINAPDSFSKEQAKRFKSAYDNDSDQLTQSYAEWKAAAPFSGGEFPAEPEEAFWQD